MIRNILVVPDKRLTTVCAKTEATGTPKEMLRELIKDLFDTCKDAGGAGLAAPQIGVLLRVFVIDTHGTRMAFVDPEIIKRSPTTVYGREGCLSIPGREVLVERSERIEVLERGQRLKFRGFVARVIQHEMDHLDGILITDEKRL